VLAVEVPLVLRVVVPVLVGVMLEVGVVVVVGVSGALGVEDGVLDGEGVPEALAERGLGVLLELNDTVEEEDDEAPAVRDEV